MGEIIEKFRALFKGKITNKNKRDVIYDALEESAKHLCMIYHVCDLKDFMKGEFEIEGESYIIEFKKVK